MGVSFKVLLIFCSCFCFKDAVCDITLNDGTLRSRSITGIQSDWEPKNNEVIRRLKRTLPTASERDLYVNTHNRLRRQEGASNMNVLKWDNALAEMASLWAQGCYWDHGQPDYANPPFSPIGQNLYVSTLTLDIEAALQSWYDEKEFYSHTDDSCEKDEICGHYTQMVWDETEYIGCAAAYCETMQLLGPRFDDSHFLVCNYGPAGNYKRAPYTKGEQCTTCSSGQFWCDEGLCTRCPGESADCECKADCKNCGTSNATTCRCACARGWTGVDCSRKCKDYDERCGANPGWPREYCPDTRYPYIPDSCPLLCGVCDSADPSDVCDESASAARQNTLTLTLLVISFTLAFQALLKNSQHNCRI